MRKYNVLIFDNKKYRSLIEECVKRFFNNKVAIEKVSTIKEGIVQLKKNSTDIIITDVIVNNQDVFTMLDEILDLNIQIILTSVKKRFAYKAVKYQVSDFVLKPIERYQLDNALKRAISKIKTNVDRKQSIMDLAQTKQKINFIAIPTNLKIIIVNTEDLLYCEALGRYTIFNMLDGVKHKSNKSIGIYEELLENNCFFRIHKKYLVNFNKVQKINKVGGYTCELLYGISLPISVRKNILLRKYLNINL